jgi:hypothetical protein
MAMGEPPVFAGKAGAEAQGERAAGGLFLSVPNSGDSTQRIKTVSSIIAIIKIGMPA